MRMPPAPPSSQPWHPLRVSWPHVLTLPVSLTPPYRCVSLAAMVVPVPAHVHRPAADHLGVSKAALRRALPRCAGGGASVLGGGVGLAAGPGPVLRLGLRQGEGVVSLPQGHWMTRHELCMATPRRMRSQEILSLGKAEKSQGWRGNALLWSGRPHQSGSSYRRAGPTSGGPLSTGRRRHVPEAAGLARAGPAVCTACTPAHMPATGRLAPP